jgi:hypothetical protein
MKQRRTVQAHGEARTHFPTRLTQASGVVRLLTKLDTGRAGCHSEVRLKLLVGRTDREREREEKFQTTLQTTKLREITFPYKIRYQMDVFI